MPHLGGVVEAPHDNITVHVVPRVLYGYVLEQTTVFTESVIHLGPHIPSLLDHAPSMIALLPWDAAQEEVTGNFFQAYIR